MVSKTLNKINFRKHAKQICTYEYYLITTPKRTTKILTVAKNVSIKSYAIGTQADRRKY